MNIFENKETQLDYWIYESVKDKSFEELFVIQNEIGRYFFTNIYFISLFEYLIPALDLILERSTNHFLI